MAWGCCSHSRVLPSISVNRKVTVPVGRSAIQHLRTAHRQTQLYDSTGRTHASASPIPIDDTAFRAVRRSVLPCAKIIALEWSHLPIAPGSCLRAGRRVQALRDGVGGGLGARGDAQLAEDGADMYLGGALGDHQRIGDRAIAGTLGDERQHLPLVRRLRAETVRRGAGRLRSLGGRFRRAGGSASAGTRSAYAMACSGVIARPATQAAVKVASSSWARAASTSRS